MARLAWILAAVPWVTPQQESEALSIEQELAALIEKTNAVETLHLVYDMEGSADEWPSKATLRSCTGRLISAASASPAPRVRWTAGSTLHRDTVTEENSEWIEQLHDHVDRLAEWVRAQSLSKNPPPPASSAGCAVASLRLLRVFLR